MSELREAKLAGKLGLCALRNEGSKKEEKAACKEGELTLRSLSLRCLVITRVNSGFGKQLLLLLLPFASFNVGKLTLRVQLLIAF